jgi:hypothetical protein
MAGKCNRFHRGKDMWWWRCPGYRRPNEGAEFENSLKFGLGKMEVITAGTCTLCMLCCAYDTAGYMFAYSGAPNETSCSNCIRTSSERESPDTLFESRLQQTHDCSSVLVVGISLVLSNVRIHTNVISNRRLPCSSHCRSFIKPSINLSTPFFCCSVLFSIIELCTIFLHCFKRGALCSLLRSHCLCGSNCCM